MYRYFNVLFVTLAILLVSGCGTTNLKVKASEAELVSNKDKAYVIFMREDTYMGSAHSPDIYEFDTKTFKPQYVANLSIGDKLVWEVDEGVHHFYVDYFMKSINTLDAKKGETYYVSINEASAKPRFLSEKDKPEQIISRLHCNDKLINQYLFEDSINYDEEDSKRKYYSSPAMIRDISCSDGNVYVGETVNSINMPMIEELKKSTNFVRVSQDITRGFTGSSKEKSIQEEIRAFYPIWKAKFEGIPDGEFLRVNKLVDSKFYKKFDGVQLNMVGHNKLIDNSDAENFSQQAKRINKVGKHNIQANLRLLKLDDGSQAGRYFAIGFTASQIISSAKKSAGAIHLLVDFVDSNNDVISSIEISDTMIGGFFGGFNTTKGNAIDMLDSYVSKNLLQ